LVVIQRTLPNLISGSQHQNKKAACGSTALSKLLYPVWSFYCYALDKKSNQKNQEPMISNTSVHFVLFGCCTIAFHAVELVKRNASLIHYRLLLTAQSSWLEAYYSFSIVHCFNYFGSA
jgi:hypothetical protein